IGLLQIIGPSSGLQASSGLLKVALKGEATDREIEDAIESLSARSIIVYRRHTASHALWEGSDVDIEERLRSARQSVEHDQDLVAFLTNESPPLPLIARRHYFQTGTLRYFDCCYVDRRAMQIDLFQGTISIQASDGDGRLIFCLPRDIQ